MKGNCILHYCIKWGALMFRGFQVFADWKFQLTTAQRKAFQTCFCKYYSEIKCQSWQRWRRWTFATGTLNYLNFPLSALWPFLFYFIIHHHLPQSSVSDVLKNCYYFPSIKCWDHLRSEGNQSKIKCNH